MWKTELNQSWLVQLRFLRFENRNEHIIIFIYLYWYLFFEPNFKPNFQTQMFWKVNLKLKHVKRNLSNNGLRSLFFCFLPSSHISLPLRFLLFLPSRLAIFFPFSFSFVSPQQLSSLPLLSSCLNLITNSFLRLSSSFFVLLSFAIATHRLYPS